MKTKIVLAMFLILGTLGAIAEEIGKITFEQPGNYKFTEEQLRFNVQSQTGQQFDEKILNEDIKRLSSTGMFADVLSSTSKGDDGKVNIVITVTPKPVIKTVTFKGNKKFKTDELKKHITLATDVPLQDKKLRDSASGLRDFYKAEGYNSATVTPKVTKDGEGLLDVTFIINENLKLKVDDVTFVGNKLFSNWTLKRTIANQYSMFSWLFNVGLYDAEELDKDKLRIRELYWNEGYLDFTITNVEVVQDSGNPEYVDITFNIEEGKPYKVNKVYFSGNEKFDDAHLQGLLNLKSGQVYDNRVERSDVSRISDDYYDLGYADFVCKAVRTPDFERHTVDIEYQIIEGQSYRVRRVNISGNRVTKDKVIRRELAIGPNDPVNQNRIEASKQRLMGIGYFEKVEAVTVNTGEATTKDVNFKVKEKDTAHFKIGGGFSDTDSVVGMVELAQTNFDISDPGSYFTGGGQRLRAQGFFGIRRYDFVLNFTEPWLLDYKLKLDTNAYMRNFSYKDWDERRIGGDITLSKPFFSEFNTLSLSHKFEQVKIHNMDNDLDYVFQKEETTDYVSTFTLNLERDTTDDLYTPTEGYKVNGLAAITAKGIGASNDYYRLEAGAKHYWSILDKAIVLKLGGKVGAVDMIGDDSRVPIYERYFIGGGDSIRGFPWREVGPYDGNEDPLGGENMFLLTAEVTHPIFSFIRGAIFVDAGNSYSRAGIFRVDKINVGAGYGLRLKVPNFPAPIRLDLAYPINNEQDNIKDRLRFHFNMGFSW